MRFRAVGVVVVVLALLALQGVGSAAPRAATATPAQIVRELNTQRHANGIPAGVRLNSTWSGKCKKHDHYMDVNDVLTHVEVKGSPGYTAGGAWAGLNSVLDEGASWRSGNPYEFAPIHLAQLLQPRLNSTGAAELSGASGLWGCTTTWPGYHRRDAKTNRISTYPGNGRTGVNYAYDAAEFPETPNQLVGAPDHCGQELFVFVSGPALTAGAGDPFSFDITKASLRPAGSSAVRVKIADAVLPFQGAHLGNYLGPGAGIVIPVKPLRPSTRYVASVTMKGNGVTISKTWSFTTKRKSSS